MRGTPRPYQVEGTQFIVDNPYVGLFDDMGLGKTKQLIDAAMTLFKRGEIHRVLIVCPASVRSVWYNPEFGELAKWLWFDVPARVGEYHSRMRHWKWAQDSNTKEFIHFIITNYEFIRIKERRELIEKLCDYKTMLVVDESSNVKSAQAKQAKACLKLRQRCGRVVLFNGTPISNNIGDAFMQAKIMHNSILDCKSWTHFRSRYAVMGGFRNRQVVDWINVGEIQRKLKPYVMRRLKEDHLKDLPPKLDPVTIEVPLSESTWKMYKEMRDDMVTWLEDTDEMVIAQQAVVKVLRLAQLCTGFIGGVDDHTGEPTIREVSREKLDFFSQWFGERLEEKPNTKMIVWCRFTAQLERLFNETSPRVPYSGKIYGKQSRDDREASLRLLDPSLTPRDSPVLMVGNPKAGGVGLNLAAAHTAVYMSSCYNLLLRMQSEDRIHRPGQIYPVSYFDVIATGPAGQKTIDHSIIRAVRAKRDMANTTTSAWVRELMEE